MDKVERRPKSPSESAAPRPTLEWDYARFRAIADEVGAILLADISHPSGLIAAGLLDNPLPHCRDVDHAQDPSRPSWRHHQIGKISPTLGG